MAGISIFLIISFLLFFIFTRESRVKLIQGDTFRIEIHLQIIAIVLIKRKNTDDNTPEKKKKGKLTKRERERIVTAVFRLIKRGEILISSCSIPYAFVGMEEIAAYGRLGYRILISSLIAYLQSKTEKLNIKDDAIILSPDTKKLQYDVTIKCRLYELVYAIMTIIIGIIKERKRKINVRE